MAVLLFRCDATPLIGLGHYRRISCLAEIVEDKKILAIKTDDMSLIQEARNIFHEVIHIPTTAGPTEEERYLLDLKVDVCILDISNAMTYSKIDEFPTLLKFYSSLGKTTVIDGLGHDSLFSHCPSLQCDFLITPYVGSHHLEGAFEHLSGEQFFILNKEYMKHFYKIRPNAKNVLITMGGSDPTDITLALTKYLLNKKSSANYRLVIGPLFTKAQAQAIAEEIEGQKNWSLVKNPKEMIKEYLNSDIVISASGLTKYELSALGIPMVLISRNQEMYNINIPFSRISNCLDFGPFENNLPDIFIEHLEALLLDYKHRFSLSPKLKSLIDCKGPERILSCILPK